MKRLALLAGLLLSAAPAAGTPAEIQRIESRIEALGVPVVWSNGHAICSDRSTLGLYLLDKQMIVMCQANLNRHNQPLLTTLKHEAWHAVQFNCNRGNAVLSDDKIRRLISTADRRTIESKYPPDQWRAEAEARALEHVPTNAFLNGVNHYCR